MLIDYEYGDWNPMAYDIANFFNEHTRDNAAEESRYDCGVKYCESNFLTREEMESFAAEYLKNFFLHSENRNASE